MGLTQTTAPTVEPLSTAEAKTHLRVDHANDDAYIDSLVAAARFDMETVTWRQFVTATYTLTLDAFPACDHINLPRPPLQSITSITYVDTAGDTQTLATSVYDDAINTSPGRIVLAYNQSWPSIRTQRDAVTIVYVAGYGDAGSDVPELVRTGMRLRVAHWYENREAVVVGTIAKELPIGVLRIDNIAKFRGKVDGLVSDP